MSKAAELAALIGSQTALSNRNLIINGAMQVAQRSTSAVAANGNFNTLDRWIAYDGTDGAYTTEQSTTAPAGFSNSLKAVVTTADTSLGAAQYAYFLQGIERQNLQNLEYGLSTAKNITLSFWVRSSKTGTYCIAMEKHDNTRYHFVKEYTINSADTWEKKEITISPTAGSTSFITSSAGAMVSDNSLGARIDFWLAAGSDFTTGVTDNSWSSDTNDYATSNQVNWMDTIGNDFYLTGVQLEVGEQATPFEHRSYADELVRCQRYYEIITSTDAAYTLHLYYATSSDYRTHWDMQVTKRAKPTVARISGTGSFQHNSGDANYFESPDRIEFGANAYSYLNNSGNADIPVFYADAEL
jgi:hypothetical protein